MTDPSGPYVFILSWERPVYLWASLDSLFRRTRTPCRFVLVDNGSTDPLVRQVITGFERRGMFHAVHLMESNEPGNLASVLEGYLPQAGSHFAYVESDITIEAPAEGCWLGTLMALAEEDPRRAMLGSYVDPRDFADIEGTRHLFPDMEEEAYLRLLKASSPERNLPVVPPAEPLICPFGPPGRVLLLRTEAIAPIGMRADAELHLALTARGWTTGISTAVRHRHLSLLHVFDEPGYDTAGRTAFFEEFSRAGAGRGVADAPPAPPPSDAAASRRRFSRRRP
jgi:hypothetical protein